MPSKEGSAAGLRRVPEILPGDIILDETEVAAQGRSPTSVTCTVPRFAMRVAKAVRWSSMVWAGPRDAHSARRSISPPTGLVSPPLVHGATPGRFMPNGRG